MSENTPTESTVEKQSPSEAARREYHQRYYRAHKDKWAWPTDPDKRRALNDAQMRRYHENKEDPEFKAARSDYESDRRKKLKQDPEAYRRLRRLENERYARWIASLSDEEKTQMWKESRERKLAKDPKFDKRHDAKRKNDPQRKASKSAHGKIYRNKNRKKINRQKLAWQRKKMLTDPYFRTVRYLRNRQARAIQQAGQNKMGRSFELLGCDQVTLIRHIESLFQSGMTWENRGMEPGTWQIDHIVPLFRFDLRTLESQKAAFRYTNLQPLWYEDHLKKSASEEPDWRNKKAQPKLGCESA